MAMLNNQMASTSYVLDSGGSMQWSCCENHVFFEPVHLTELNLGPGRKDPRPQILMAHPTY